MVRGMAFGRDSEGAFLFCLPFFLPPLIFLRVSLGNRHDMTKRIATKASRYSLPRSQKGLGADQESRIAFTCGEKRQLVSLPLLRHLTN